MTGLESVIQRGEAPGASVPPPSVLLPDAALAFDRRARRLVAWADSHPMADYLAFLSVLADAQQSVSALPLVMPDQSILDRRFEHGMPLLPADAQFLDPAWQAVLAEILVQMRGNSLPDQAGDAINALRAMAPSSQDEMAARFLKGQLAKEDLGLGLFVAAAMQVVWLRLASALPPALPKAIDPPGLCPVCGSAPVGGVLMAGGPLEGVRYLACGLCGSFWHFPRAQCTHCQSEKEIAYYSFEGLTSPARAEACQDCRIYLKLFDEAKAPGVEPFADDLATVGLDLRMAEDGWRRAAPNPFLLAGG
ncbi:MAG: formate dehydrogenase accessory protein FdhE [Rhodospirillales bacterium]|nr:MAG: formate dehydrogenase accessory protein FdhE [Rhodospirillales bacterium]